MEHLYVQQIRVANSVSIWNMSKCYNYNQVLHKIVKRFVQSIVEVTFTSKHKYNPIKYFSLVNIFYVQTAYN